MIPVAVDPEIVLDQVARPLASEVNTFHNHGIPPVILT